MCRGFVVVLVVLGLPQHCCQHQYYWIKKGGEERQCRQRGTVCFIPVCVFQLFFVVLMCGEQIPAPVCAGPGDSQAVPRGFQRRLLQLQIY